MKLDEEVAKNINTYVVPYIGTWIETIKKEQGIRKAVVVPYIGTWIETFPRAFSHRQHLVVPYIGTWIETMNRNALLSVWRRTLYRYVD